MAKDEEPKIKRGDLCMCSIGKLGYVTSDGRRTVFYDDGNEGEAYVGICLTDGKPWSSRNPTRLCSVVEFKRNLDDAEFAAWWDDVGHLYGPEDVDDAARGAFIHARHLL